MIRFSGAILFILIFLGCSEKSQYVQLPMPYPGETKALFNSFETRSEYVPMSDGTKIATDIFLPTQGVDQARFPVVLSYTAKLRFTTST